jgi:hypothetical protein
MVLPGMEKVIGPKSATIHRFEEKGGKINLPSRGSHDLGSTLFQYLLCSLATCHIVSVAVSPAIIGGNSSGG